MANEMRDRLVELVQDALFKYAHYIGKERRRALEPETEAEHSEIYESIKALHEYVADHLIENGVVILPCRSGDYVKWDNGIDYKLKEVKGFVFNNSPEKHLRQRLILEDCQPIFSHEGILGYMPKSEAEQKLKEMRGVE